MSWFLCKELHRLPPFPLYRVWNRMSGFGRCSSVGRHFRPDFGSSICLHKSVGSSSSRYFVSLAAEGVRFRCREMILDMADSKMRIRFISSSCPTRRTNVEYIMDEQVAFRAVVTFALWTTISSKSAKPISSIRIRRS